MAASGSANSSIRVEAIPISNGPVVIFVQGTFEANDTPTELIRLVVINSAKLVSFDSNGGSIATAIAFGRAIRQLGLTTIQLRKAECASACALAFFGGVSRVADPGSIGVHQTSFANGASLDGPTAATEVQSATAVIIGYFVEMGIDPKLLQLSLATPNTDMRYLTKQEMEEFRVTTSTSDSIKQTASMPPSVQPAVPAPGQERATLVPPPLPAPSDNLQAEAVRFVVRVMDAHAETSANYVALKSVFFADLVNYYGASRTKADVIELEQKYVERWPIRRGSIRAKTITASCSGQVCNVAGLYDWIASNPALHKRSAGTTQFMYQVDMRATPKIIGQNGTVVERR